MAVSYNIAIGSRDVAIVPNAIDAKDDSIVPATSSPFAARGPRDRTLIHCSGILGTTVAAV